MNFNWDHQQHERRGTINRIIGLAGWILALVFLILGLLVYFRLGTLTGLVTNKPEDFAKYQEEIASSDLITNNMSTIEETTVLNMIYVDIKGQVHHPGVYPLTPGSRMFDLIEEAGGLLPGAADRAINQAQVLEDQMVVLIPSNEEWLLAQTPNLDQELIENPSSAINLVQGHVPGQNQDKDTSGTVLININTADQATLETLPNIGPSKAGQIIAYREQMGSFKTIEEIQEVPGIGPKTYENLKDLIQVGP